MAEKPEQGLVESFFNAFRGIKHTLRERNFVIQITVGVFAIAFALALNLSRTDDAIIVMLIAFVLSTEMINSACERMLDLVTREHNAEAGRIKDMLAGAVLIYSIAAVVIGIWIFSNAIVR